MRVAHIYDAEGNILAVDGGSTASYQYNALNQRVETTVSGAPQNFVYNAAGQRVTIWNANTGVQTQGQYYWGAQRVGFYSGGSLHFQHQDWMGTERARTTYNGGVEGTFASLPFGDGLTTVSGTDLDAYHFATVDHDYEDETDHAQFRQYSEAQGHWLAPDPYGGSYDFSNPQSFNRYAYVLNNPLSNVDPSGLVLCDYGTNADGSEEYGDEDTDADCIASQGTVVNVGATVTVGASGNSSISVGGIVFIFGPANAPNKGILHSLVCSIPGGLHQLSNVLGHGTVGVGLGGSAGAGIWSQGFAISADIQIVATPDKSLALVGSFSATTPFSGVVLGAGASVGVQGSWSNAQTPSQLAGPSVSVNGGGGWVEGASANAQFGLATNGNGQLTGQFTGVNSYSVTGGFAAGAEGTVASISQTGVLAATNCSDIW